MAIIAKYKFNPSLYADYLPTFNAEFTGYTKSDVNNSDGTITRTISHDTLKPTLMRFGGAINTSTDREKSLLEVMECDTSNVTSMHTMFSGCSNLISLNTSNFDTSKVTNMFFAFNGCLSLASLNLSSFDTSKVTNMNSIFENCSALTSLNVSSWDTSNVTDIAYMFNNCKSLTSLDLSSFNTSKATNMTKIFNGCSKLTSLVLSNFNTSKVENMTNMFTNCSSLTSLDISNFNTSKVTTMRDMFSGCSSLTSLNVSSFDTGNVTIMYAMFQNCSSLTTLDLSNFNTSKVTNMNSIFENCRALTSLNVSSFDTSKATDISYMFNGCSSLTSLDVSNFNTSNVTTIRYMFRNCSNLTTLDLSSFNTSKVTNMSWMFNECSKLTTLDLSNFDTSSVTDMSYMLGSNCSASNIGLLYATSSTINSLVTQLGTYVARDIYYTDAPLDELTVQDNITYKKYVLSKATLPHTLNKLPNGVADYIDVVNKIHVQRVGVSLLEQGDFKCSAYMKNVENDNYVHYYSSAYSQIAGGSVKIICDKLPTLSSIDLTKGEGISLGGSQNFDVILDKNKLGSTPVKEYLASLNLTILYPLATPIYTPLTDKEIAQLPLSAYADGYVMLSSDQLMPSFEFRMRASNRYQVDMLETGYYYLNAPVGNVRLGTANVDVQQMPCIVKVDNVGTGDSGYRLNTTEGFYIESSANDFVLFDQRLSADGSIVEQEDMGITDYYNIPLLQNSSYIFNYNSTNDVNVFVAFYDIDKNHIKTNWHSKNNEVNLVPVGSKYARLSYNMYSGLKIRMFTPITLAKLPSHRIPTSFTQGMKCGTDFGYWEGAMESKPTSFRTANPSSGWSIVETSSIEGGMGVVLNRIEIGLASLIIEDELDIATGKFTKRVGKLVLDGSSDESWYSKNRSETYVKTNFFIISLPTKSRENYICINNRLPYDVGWAGDFERLWIDNRDSLVVHTDKAFSVDSFRKYLASNPIIVYYPLAVPEISYLNTSLSQVKTVANTGLQCTRNNGYLNAQVKPSHLTYPVPSLVANREYTVVHNRKNITGSTKPIELNLGGTVVQLNDASGKTLVKTPSSLKHSSLIFIGGESTVDHIMVLDGDWTNKPIEYFENMKGHDTDAIITIMGDGKIDDVAEQYLW